MRELRRLLATVFSLTGLLVVAAALMAPTGGFPSRPQFRALGLETAAPASGLYLFDAAADADERLWSLDVVTGCLELRAREDDGTSQDLLLNSCRSATGIISLDLSAPEGDVTASHAGGAAGPVGVVDRGSYTGAVTGCTTDPAPVIFWTRIGGRADSPANGDGMVSLKIPTFSCTSNATNFSIAGAPEIIWPTGALTGLQAAYQTTDNSVASQDGTAAIGMTTAGVLNFYKDGSSTGWTASGTKGSGTNQFTYQLDNG